MLSPATVSSTFLRNCSMASTRTARTVDPDLVADAELSLFDAARRDEAAILDEEHV